MDELQISGKRFISSRRVARENGYTSDYIGQLIRGGKIVGQKVGRAWYVDAASFDRFLGSEETPAQVSQKIEEPMVTAVAFSAPESPAEVIEEVEAPAAVEIKQEIEEKIEIPTPAVKPVEETPVVITKTTEETHHVPLRLNVQEKSSTGTIGGGLRYFADDTPLLPEIPSSKKESRVIEVSASAQESSEKVFAAATPRRTRPVVIGSLAALGIAVFLFSAVVSSSLTLNLTIQDGNAASSFYGLNW
jgi:hypothetical protein